MRICVCVCVDVCACVNGGSPKKETNDDDDDDLSPFSPEKTCSEPHPPLSPPPVPQCLPALRLLVAAHHHLAG